MIPRLHPRGTSFKEACRYILHDVAQDSADRVAWVRVLSHGYAARRGVQ